MPSRILTSCRRFLVLNTPLLVTAFPDASSASDCCRELYALYAPTRSSHLQVSVARSRVFDAPVPLLTGTGEQARARPLKRETLPKEAGMGRQKWILLRFSRKRRRKLQPCKRTLRYVEAPPPRWTRQCPKNVHPLRVGIPQPACNTWFLGRTTDSGRWQTRRIFARPKTTKLPR